MGRFCPRKGRYPHEERSDGATNHGAYTPSSLYLGCVAQFYTFFVCPCGSLTIWASGARTDCYLLSAFGQADSCLTDFASAEVSGYEGRWIEWKNTSGGKYEYNLKFVYLRLPMYCQSFHFPDRNLRIKGHKKEPSRQGKTPFLFFTCKRRLKSAYLMAYPLWEGRNAPYKYHFCKFKPSDTKHLKDTFWFFWNITYPYPDCTTHSNRLI